METFSQEKEYGWEEQEILDNKKGKEECDEAVVEGNMEKPCNIHIAFTWAYMDVHFRLYAHGGIELGV